MTTRQHQRTERRDLHKEITDQLVAAIEADPGQPSLPWRRATSPLSMPQNALTKKHYSGINILSLWVAAEMRQYAAPIWGTYRQWNELGAQVRKGERSSTVIFYKEYATEPDPDSADDDGKRRVARASSVFNASQVDGYALPDAPPLLGPIERIDAADRYFAHIGARIEHAGDRAYYRPSTDHIQMPDEGLFCGTATMTRTEGYYATLAHEHIHFTMPEHRCDRARALDRRFGKSALAAEELVAEIGAAILCCELGITQDVRPDHAQYLAEWLTLLRNDSRAIFTAAAKASAAIAWLHQQQPAPK